MIHTTTLIRIVFALLAIAGSLIPPAAATAQQGKIDKRLILSVLPAYGISRGHAPVSLEISLQWHSADLIEGHLQLDWYVNGTRLGRHLSTPLALSNSSLEFDVLLPPVILPDDDAVFSVQGTFVTENTNFDLDVHDVALQPDWRRILCVGLCTSPQPAKGAMAVEVGMQQGKLIEKFDVEQFFANRFTRRELYVEETEVDPTQVPVEPLRMSAFDLFVVPADALPKLKPRQLQSLLTWARAGGSLCVYVDTSVPAGHVEWLNHLAGRDLADAAYMRDPEGQVTATEGPSDAMNLHYTDLGRTVVVLGDAGGDTRNWQEAVLFLWKARSDRRLVAQGGQKWQVEDRTFRDGYTRYATLEPNRLYGQATLTRMLLPDSVRGLPAQTVLVVLIVFLLVIAPVDYYLLGWLRRRRWTWILFPAASLLFTAYTIFLARQHLGHISYVRGVTVVDLGHNGETVRTSRFELLYAASNRTHTTPHQSEIMVPLDPSVEHFDGRSYGPGVPRGYEQPWTFIGNVPRDYTVNRNVQQWAPRLARTTSLGRDSVPHRSTSSGADDTVLDQTTDVVPGPRIDRFRMQGDRIRVEQRAGRVPAQIVDLATSITRRPESGFFSVFSQLSPTCGGNWEDLALLDSSDSGQTVVVEISSPSEGEYVITRRLERK